MIKESRKLSTRTVSIAFGVVVILQIFQCASGQYSLEQMIERYKQEHGLVYQDTTTQTPQSQFGYQQQPWQQNQQSNYYQQQQPNNNYVNYNANSNAPVPEGFNPYASNVVSKSVLQLARNIGTVLDYGSETKTQVFSPLSIAGALSLVLLGSNSHTFQELMGLFGYNRDTLLSAQPYRIHEEFGYLIEDLLNNNQNLARPRPLSPWRYGTHPQDHQPQQLRVQGNPTDYHKISVANGVFVQNGYNLRPDYKEALQSVYRSDVVPLDFVYNTAYARDYINNWVMDRTQGKIKEIVGGDINPNTKVIVTSALYFKALWEKAFIDGGTNLRNFYPDGLEGRPVQVQMMAHGGVFPFYDAKEYDCRILGLPYKGNMSTMYIILPNNSNRQKLRQMQSFLDADKIEDMISKMQLKSTIMIFPKMHIENRFNLNDILYKLGIRSLFSNSYSDLSLMADGNANQQVYRPNYYPMTEYQNDQPLIFTRFGDENSKQDDDGKIMFHDDEVDGGNDTKQVKNDETEKKKEETESEERTTTPATTTASSKRSKRAVKYKVESTFRRNSEPLRLKDFIINKRITKVSPHKKYSRHRRQAVNGGNWSQQSAVPSPTTNSIKNLDALRMQSGLANPGLFVDKVLHKIDLTINEQGTEGGAATVVYLTRTGTDVVFRVETPFMFVIRHDTTRLPIFYGSVYEPTDF